VNATGATGKACETVRDRLAGYLEDNLIAADARAVREHVAACPACRDDAVARDPSLLFARAGSEEVSSEDVAAVLAGVRAGLALRKTERKLGSGRSRRRLGATAAAAALAAMVLVLPGSGRRPAETLTVATPAPAAAAPGFSPAGAASPGGTFPADATIYDWNPGAGTEEPRVVWIVDRSLDI
jgi:anti-sigma factor RsiW